jgi:hypothetical protein
VRQWSTERRVSGFEEFVRSSWSMCEMGPDSVLNQIGNNQETTEDCLEPALRCEGQDRDCQKDQHQREQDVSDGDGDLFARRGLHRSLVVCD